MMVTFFALDEAQIGVLVVINLHSFLLSLPAVNAGNQTRRDALAATDPAGAGAHGFQDGARSMASMKASSLPGRR